MTSLGSPATRVVVVGTAHHRDPGRLPDVEAVATSIADLERCLLDPEICGVRPESLRVLLDPPDPGALDDVIRQAAVEAEDVFLLYYLGHGLVSENALYLATQATADISRTRASTEALEFAAVTGALRHCRAATIVVVLDCCDAGRAHLGGLRGDWLLLASTRRSVQALAPEGARHTLFTGELLSILAEGDPQGPPQLTLARVTDLLRGRLQPAGQAPVARYEGGAGRLVLAPNRAYRPPRLDNPPPEDLDGAEEVCPYLGLNGYDTADERLFFGRREITETLLRAASTRVFGADPLIVVGASGVGKSSLLRAGLLPEIKKGALGVPGSAGWVHLVMTLGAGPGRADPMDLLAEQLATLTGRDDPDDDLRVRHALATDPRREVGRLLDGRKLVLVLDQFEDLFIQHPNRAAEFVATVTGLIGPDESAPVALVALGVRADHLGHCLELPEIAGAARNALTVPPMAPDELREVITGPARVAGLAVDDELTRVVLRDLDLHPRSERRAAVLPHLSYALLATWQKRTGRRLTANDYLAAGGIDSAIALRADAIYRELDEPGQRAARNIFLQMVLTSEDGEDTTRIAAVQELVLDGVGATVLDAFVRARLVTVHGESVYVHEALLKAWPRLREWIDDDRETLRARARLRQAVREWERDGADRSLLFGGARLEAALPWLTDDNVRLTDPERAFLTASKNRRRAEVRRLYQVIAFLTVLLILAVVASGYAFDQRGRADANAREATVRQLLAVADTIRDSDPQAALTFDLAALRLARTAENRSNLVTALVGAHYGGTARTPGVDSSYSDVVATAFSRDGAMLAMAHDDDTVSVWPIAGRHVLDPHLVKFRTNGANHLRFSDDGRSLAVVGDRADRDNVTDALVWWDISDPKRPYRARTVVGGRLLALAPDGRTGVRAGAGGPVLVRVDGARLVDTASLGRGIGKVAGISQDGRLMVTEGTYGGHTIWDIADRSRPVRLADFQQSLPQREITMVSNSPWQSASFSADNTLVAIASNLGPAVLVDISNPRRPRQVSDLANPAVVSTVSTVAFSRWGRTLAVGSIGQVVRLWDVSDPAHPRATATLGGAGGDVTSLAFSPDGRSIASGGMHGGTDLWNLGPADPAPVSYEAGGVGVTAGLGADGRTLVTGGLAVHTTVRDIAAPARTAVSTTVPASRVGVVGVAISPDGRTVAERNLDGTTTLWDTARRGHPRLLRTLPTRGASDLFPETRRLVRFSPDGRTLAVNDPVSDPENPVFELWDVTDPRQPRPLTSIAGTTNEESFTAPAAAFSPDSRLFVIERKGEVTLWDIADRLRPRMAGTLPTPGGAMTFGGDGRLLAVVTGEGTEVWDVGDPAHPRMVSSAPYGGKTVAFSPDGRVLATGAGRTVVLMSVAEPGQAGGVVPLHGHSREVFAVTFTPGGHLVSVDIEGGLKLWNADGLLTILAEPEWAACALVDPGIGPERWQRYVPNQPFENVCPERFSRVCERFGMHETCWVEQVPPTGRRRPG
ncbi:hypothetical protein AAH979_42045 [Plantactinospora sp. ZYX-F-223]|uniref:caspase, EACC1-associated type n=1 Tax=Plantactinospora sp. ZYX-F-223 TaxID=3144103 RepID=UPI0031FBA86C